MLNVFHGDITDSRSEVIAQGVSCQGVMGIGLALAIREKFQDDEAIYWPYKRFCKSGEMKLGMVFPVKLKTGQFLMNIASQDKYSHHVKCGSKEHLIEGLEKTKAWMHSRGLKTIALPLIGAGYGKLTTKESRDAIAQVFNADDDISARLVVDKKAVYLEVYEKLNQISIVDDESPCNEME